MVSVRRLAQQAEQTASDSSASSDARSADQAEQSEHVERSEAKAQADDNENIERSDAKAEASASAESGESSSSSSTDGAPEKEPEVEAAAEKEPEVEVSPEDKLRQEVSELQEKLRSQKHEHLLSLADFENNKKRYAKEREARRRRATRNFAEKMVDVYVEFDAIAAASPKTGSSEACQALHEGIVMTRDLYKSTLEKFGLAQLLVEPGQPFVATKHESIGSIAGTEGIAEGTVAELAQPGWSLEQSGGQEPLVLRKAQVKIASA